MEPSRGSCTCASGSCGVCGELWRLGRAVVTPGDRELQEALSRQALLARSGHLMAIMRGLCYCRQPWQDTLPSANSLP